MKLSLFVAGVLAALMPLAAAEPVSDALGAVGLFPCTGGCEGTGLPIGPPGSGCKLNGLPGLEDPGA